MTDPLLDKSPSARHSATPLQQLPVRRMRNTAVLVKWIEEHQSNPYPTKAEKQYLAYYSGMNMTQLSTWFANARRRIKKIGMKTWLEGRSTFTVDFFPAAGAAFTSRPAVAADYVNGSGAAYNPPLGSSTNPYATMQYPSLAGSYPTGQHTPTAGLGIPNHRLYNTDTMPLSSSSSSVNYGLYTPTCSSRQTPFLNLANWSLSTSTPSAVSGLQGRPSSNTGPTLHSPLTAQAYSADASILRTQAALDMSEAGPYSMPQRSPDQMLPECASAEPMMQGSSPKTHYSE